MVSASSAELFANRHGQRRHALGVPRGIGIARVERSGQRADGAEVGRLGFCFRGRAGRHQRVERRRQLIEFAAAAAGDERRGRAVRRRHVRQRRGQAIDRLRQRARQPHAANDRERDGEERDPSEARKRRPGFARRCRVDRRKREQAHLADVDERLHRPCFTGQLNALCAAPPARRRSLPARQPAPATACWP